MKTRDKRFDLYEHKATAIVYIVLRVLVILTLISSLMRREFENVFMCGLTLVLMIMPSILSKKLRITLPSILEIIILLFVFAAEILGEINCFYMKIPNWDTVLHTINGFCCAAIGFSLIDMLNRSDRFSIKLSPIYVALVAFCFSMTVGVMWEFYEFGADRLMHSDMQKDTIVHSISTVELDKSITNTAVRVNDIADVIIVHSDNTQESLGLGGYLDIGLIDTMKDLFVNFIGAVIFSVIGFFYVKEKGKGRFAAKFIPQVAQDDRKG